MSRTATYIAAALWILLPVFAQGQEHPPAAAPAGQHAAQEHGKEEHAASGHQNLDGWKWANFGLLAGALGYFIAKNSGPFFASRSQEIQKGITAAEKLRADAEARMAAVDARLKNLQQEIAELQNTAAFQQQIEAERLRQETAAEIQKVQAQAAQEIAAAGKAARLELKRYSAQLALGLAEQKVRQRITPEVQNDLVQGFVHKLAQPNTPR